MENSGCWISPDGATRVNSCVPDRAMLKFAVMFANCFIHFKDVDNQTKCPHFLDSPGILTAQRSP